MHIKLWLTASLCATLLLGCATQETTSTIDDTPVMSPIVDLEIPVQASTEATGEITPEALATDPLYYLETVTHSDSVYAPGDETVLLAAYEYYLPILQTDDHTNLEAMTVVETFNKQFSMWEDSNDFAQTAVYAHNHYQSTIDAGDQWAIHYQYELSTYAYQTSGLISLEGVYYSFTGGAHPNTLLLSWLFDLTTGTFISPLTLAKDPQMFADAVAQELIAQTQTGTLEGYPLEELYWDDYQTVLSSWDSYCVYFNEEGMQVGFSPYELAAYAAGTQFFTIPYDTIIPYLSDQALAMLDLA